MAPAIHNKAPAARMLARIAMILLLCFAVTAQPAAAQSILRDAETEALFREMSRPLIEAAGLRPDDVEIVLIQNPEPNAFVAGGQIVFIHSGTITASDNANEVQGVIAHELGHITGGHIIRIGEGYQSATTITLLSLLLGAAAIAAGAGDAGAGIMAAGQQAAMGKFLAYNRTQESSADQAGATFLSKAGISGRGSLAFFKKLQNMEFRLAIPQTDSYGRTHPLTGERMSILENVYRTDPAWDTPTDPALEAKFQRVKGKLAGYVDDPKRTLIRYPESDKSVPARYARAYAWHKSAYPQKAAAEVDALLAGHPKDPFFLELQGQILLESGRPDEALTPLRDAIRLAPNEPLIASTFGHALISTDDESHYEEAKRVLRNAVVRDNSNPFAWYQLGIVYDREGDEARASLATAERYNLTGKPSLALANAELAMKGIPEGTPDWIRAQDIAMVARSAVAKRKDR
jgi:predicted Zn-dependent protease